MTDNSGLVELGNKVFDFIQKLAGPLAEEIGLTLGDSAKLYRLKNWTRVAAKAEKILKEAKLPPNAVPPRLLLPICETSSLEDNETLQDLWAGLLATASQQTESVSPSFVETLKQLTPDEARHLQQIYKSLRESARDQRFLANSPINPYVFTEKGGAPLGVTSDSYERLGLIRRDFEVRLRDGGSWRRREPKTISEAMYTLEKAVDDIEPETLFQFVLTRYAVTFLDSCTGPTA